MKFKNYLQSEKQENPHGISSVKLHDSVNAVIMHLSLKPGEKLKPHQTQVDVVFYVLEGQATILVGDEKMDFPSDTLIESPKMITHCIYNNFDKILRVLVIKTPKPTAKTIFPEEEK